MLSFLSSLEALGVMFAFQLMFTQLDTSTNNKKKKKETWNRNVNLK